MQEQQFETKQKAEALTPMEDSWTIFLVDDDLDDLILAKRVLEGFIDINKIVSLKSGEELLEELKKRNFYEEFASGNTPENCLIILDMHMPKHDGISILQELKDNPYTNHIPVLMLTQDADTGHIETTYHMQANGYLTKPLTDNHIGIIRNVFTKGNDWKT